MWFSIGRIWQKLCRNGSPVVKRSSRKIRSAKRNLSTGPDRSLPIAKKKEKLSTSQFKEIVTGPVGESPVGREKRRKVKARHNCHRGWVYAMGNSGGVPLPIGASPCEICNPDAFHPCPLEPPDPEVDLEPMIKKYSKYYVVKNPVQIDHQCDKGWIYRAVMSTKGPDFIAIPCPTCNPSGQRFCRVSRIEMIPN